MRVSFLLGLPKLLIVRQGVCVRVWRGMGRPRLRPLAAHHRTRGYGMRKTLMLSLALIHLAGCATGTTYTIQSADERDANERAAQYCERRNGVAMLQARGQIDVYRCFSPASCGAREFGEMQC